MKRLVIVVWALNGIAFESYRPNPVEKHAIDVKLTELEKRLHDLPAKLDDGLFADVAVYRKAAEWILRYDEEFYTKTYATNTISVLDTGIARAKEIESGSHSWTDQKGRLVRAYRSQVDGSIQPYGLVIPESYTSKKPVRLDVVLHGRGATLNEVSFIAAHDKSAAVPAEQDFIQLDVFGRGNNAYRWSGETDVFEAIESVKSRYNIDPGKVVLRGFSMGGAGAWHLGLHHPDRWAAVEAGAGFTETRRYAKLDRLPPYQEATLHIYDAVDYALNAVDVPFVGYGGEDDPQLQASVNIREQLGSEGLALKDLRALFLVGPHTQHKFHPDSKRQSDAFINQGIPQETPDHIRFVTWTPRYNRCFWVTVEGLEHQYQRAEVDAQRNGSGAVVKTRNVACLLVDGAQPITIDGQRFSGRSSFEKIGGRWIARRSGTALRKRHGLQGPIDDAFMEPFLCVRPTGTGEHPAVTASARDSLDRFAHEYAKFFRADLPVKDDGAVNKEDIASHNLVLFGDPGSNRLIREIAGRLPIEWTTDNITVDGQKFSAADHMPVLVYPNPLNPNRYVVINSGHTFHERELRGTNALLFPRLGDYAVIEVPSQTVVRAGLFDENWK